MSKLKKYHINKNRLKAIYTDTKTRNLVECKCTLHYHGSRWVDSRTFDRHQQEIEWFRYIISRQRYSLTLRSIKNNSVVTETVSASKRKKVIKLVKQNYSSYEDTPKIISDLSDDREDYEIPINDEEFFTEEDNCALSEDSEDNIPFEQFTTPDFDDFDSDLEHRYSNMNINFDNS
ncbi:16322_t:CDS:2 [Funneliformis caledonium]|uniref:16322_t:CDS:1 n=1 Tax=Funneliformis caledonium TaxID=1117310 RepID=A0A9N9NQ11_9GLOM|nr:16322_t:CDS:2 [Funneliformis caledonium]